MFVMNALKDLIMLKEHVKTLKKVTIKEKKKLKKMIKIKIKTKTKIQ